MSEPVRIGLLGRGTVGGAFAELLAERAGAVEAATGRRPEVSGVLTRSEGDFSEILGRSDLIVELMGGTDPARVHLPLFALVQLEVPTYRPEACPLCARNVPVVKPGSRR